MTVNRTWAVATAVFAALVAEAGPALAQGQEVVGAPHPWQIGLQDFASPVMEQLTSFHNLLLTIITLVSLLVLALLVYVVVRFNHRANPTPSRTSHNTLLEVAWTAVPVLILIVIAVPSFKLLYFMDRTTEAELTLKVTGRQWYWDYEYPDQGNLSFSSYMIPDDEIQPGQHRLLEVDNRIVVPAGANIRLLITAGDVLHSWALPSAGVKLDAVPGRTNETWMRIEKEGVYYGQCSELCGTGHGYMPIAVEVVSKERFQEWVGQKQAELKGTGAGASKQVAQRNQ